MNPSFVTSFNRANMASRIARIARAAYAAGWMRTGGNISIHCRDRIFITPRGISADLVGELRTRQLCTVLMDGTVIGKNEPSRETAVHLIMYQRLPRAAGVIHVHSPFLLAFSEKPELLRDSTDSASRFGGLLVCRNLPSADLSLASAIDATLAAHRQETEYGTAIFVPRHGLFVASTTVERALYFTAKIEENAQVTLAQLSLGTANPVTP